MLKLQAISNTETSSVTSKPTGHINASGFAFMKIPLVLVLFRVTFRLCRKPLRKITCERVKQYIIFQAPSNVSEDLQT
jgi:hypothetical protein